MTFFSIQQNKQRMIHEVVDCSTSKLELSTSNSTQVLTFKLIVSTQFLYYTVHQIDGAKNGTTITKHSSNMVQQWRHLFDERYNFVGCSCHFIHSKGRSFTLGLNEFADMTPEDLFFLLWDCNPGLILKTNLK